MTVPSEVSRRNFLTRFKHLGLAGLVGLALTQKGCLSPFMEANREQYREWFEQLGLQKPQPPQFQFKEPPQSAYRICNRYTSQRALDFNAIQGEKSTFLEGEDFTILTFWPGEGKGKIRFMSYDTGEYFYDNEKDVHLGCTTTAPYDTIKMVKVLGGRRFKVSWILNGNVMESKDVTILPRN